ncbi:MAG: hypothetical protein ACYS76_07945 [Planctomycetota bacterium]|jgi:hypothetical protein
MEQWKAKMSGVRLVLVVVWAVALAPALCSAAQTLDVYRIEISVSKNWFDGVPEATPYDFWVGVKGIGITDVTITPPGGTPIALAPDSGERADWVFQLEDYATLGELRADFSTGNYLLTFNGGTDSATVFTNPAEPKGFANIIYPLNGSHDIPLNPTITWESSVGYGDFLYMDIGDEDTDTLLDRLPFASIAQTTWTPATLVAGHLHSFEIEVVDGMRSWWPYNLTTDQGDAFAFFDFFEYGNEVTFTAAGDEGGATIIPAPGAIFLACTGIAVVGFLRKGKKI